MASMHTSRRCIRRAARLTRGQAFDTLPRMPANRPLTHLHHHHGLTGRVGARVHE